VRFDRLLLLLLTALGLAGCAGIATQPWPAQVRDLPLGKERVTVGGIQVSAQPAEEMGTGMCGITVLDTHSGSREFLHEPNIGLRLLTFHDGWPQLEIWSRGAAGLYARSLFRVEKRKYVLLRTDDFSEEEPADRKHRRRKATLPGDRTPLYFVETRLPDPEE
jgi:hypothetical protein